MKQLVDTSYIIKWCENTIDIIKRQKEEVELHFTRFVKKQNARRFKLKIKFPTIQYNGTHYIGELLLRDSYIRFDIEKERTTQSTVYNNVSTLYVVESKSNQDLKEISLDDFYKLIDEYIQYLLTFINNIKKY